MFLDNLTENTSLRYKYNSFFLTLKNVYLAYPDFEMKLSLIFWRFTGSDLIFKIKQIFELDLPDNLIVRCRNRELKKKLPEMKGFELFDFVGIATLFSFPAFNVSMEKFQKSIHRIAHLFVCIFCCNC